MNISEAGIEAIKEYEGLRLYSYYDSGGVLTIGYGHTGSDVFDGQAITEEEADAWLRLDIAEAEDAIESYVDVDLDQNEYDALVSFIFNVGVGAFRNSTLLRLLNAGSKEGAARQFARWVHDNGEVVAGLVNRRAKERDMFMGIV